VIEDKSVEGSTSSIWLTKTPLGMFGVEVPTYQEVSTEGIKEVLEIIGI